MQLEPHNSIPQLRRVAPFIRGVGTLKHLRVPSHGGSEGGNTREEPRKRKY